MVISHWIVLRMRNDSDKIVEKVYILCSVTFFRKLVSLCDNVEKCVRQFRKASDRNIKRQMRLSCWISTATDINSEFVTLIASSRQQWLR